MFNLLKKSNVEFLKNTDTKYIMDDNISINYHYKDNGQDKTIVVFQGNGNAPQLASSYKSYISSNKSDKDKMIAINSIDEALHKMNFYKSFDDVANVLIIRDDFLVNDEDKLLAPNNFWYFRALGYDLAPYLYKFISLFKNQFNVKTENLLVMGSSKGGFPAISLAQYDDLAAQYLSLFPILSNPLRYKEHRPSEMQTFNVHFATSENLTTEQLKLIPLDYISKLFENRKLSKKLTIVCGLADEQTNLLCELPNICDYSMLIDTRIGGHLDYTVTTVNITKQLLFGIKEKSNLQKLC